MAHSALIQDFFIPVTDDALSGMTFFTILLKGYEEGITAIVLKDEKVINYGNWSFDDALTFLEKEAALRDLYPDLFDAASVIQRLWGGRRYAIVDEAYVPKQANAVLEKVTGKRGSEAHITSVPLFESYHALVNVPADCPWVFGNTFFSHLKQKCNRHPTAFLFADGPFATIHVYDGVRWVLSVPYTAQQVEDACYFVLYALEELEMVASKTNLFYAGIGFDEHGVKEVLERFMASVHSLPIEKWSINHQLQQHAVALESYVYYANH